MWTFVYIFERNGFGSLRSQNSRIFALKKSTWQQSWKSLKRGLQFAALWNAKWPQSKILTTVLLSHLFFQHHVQKSLKKSHFTTLRANRATKFFKLKLVAFWLSKCQKSTFEDWNETFLVMFKQNTEKKFRRNFENKPLVK